MPKKSVVGYFKSREEAEHAVNRLRTLGVTDVQIDESGRSTRGIFRGVVDRITSGLSDLGGLMSGTAGKREDEDLPVFETDTGDSDREESGGLARSSVFVKAEVDETFHDRAVEILRESGGTV